MPRSNVLLSALRIGFFLTLFACGTLFAFIPMQHVHAATNDTNGAGNSSTNDTNGVGNGTTNDTNGVGGGLQNPLGSTSTLNDLLGKVLDAVIAIGTVVVTIMLVYCGFLFVAAQGNEEKIRDARSALMWTVIGALVLLGAKVIAGIISATVQTL